MKVYFNWLGKWIELDNDKDLIEDISPIDFVNYNIQDYISKDNFKENIYFPLFVTIKKQNVEYHIHLSQVAWNERIIVYHNNERW